MRKKSKWKVQVGFHSVSDTVRGRRNRDRIHSEFYLALHFSSGMSIIISQSPSSKEGV
jgi:hypothetical protein